MVLPVMARVGFRYLARQAARFAAVFTIALAAALPASAGAATQPHPGTARLVPELAAITPGATLVLDLHLDIAPGWHTYWRNPGDSGLPTEIAWTLPADFTAGDIVWPVPERFVVEGLGNYGYRDAVDLLIPITVGQGVKLGATAHLDAVASWLVCSDICIPGDAKLAFALPVAAAAPDPSATGLFAAARSRLPKPAAFEAEFGVTKDQLRLMLPEGAFSGIEQPSAVFLPFDANVVDAAAEPKLQRRGSGFELLLQRANTPAAIVPKSLDGVLVLRGAKGGEQAVSLHATPAAAISAEESSAEIAWWQALLFALLGGIVLNLMPCVFPVLSLKLLSLAGAADRAAQRHHAAAYALGVILSFTALGGGLLLLRAGGAAIGWGFQLQSPVVVGLL